MGTRWTAHHWGPTLGAGTAQLQPRGKNRQPRSHLLHLCRERNPIPSGNCFIARRGSIWWEGRNGCQQTYTHTGGCHLFFPHTQQVTYYHQHVPWPRLTSGAPSPAVTMPFPSFLAFSFHFFWYIILMYVYIVIINIYFCFFTYI